MLTRSRPVPADAVLLRLPIDGPDGLLSLPPVPGGAVVTVTLGHPDLLPVDAEPARALGYRIVGAASELRPIGDVADLLVSAELRHAAPGWWDTVLRRATRAFDLRLGPVQRVLEAELALHVRAQEA